MRKNPFDETTPTAPIKPWDEMERLRASRRRRGYLAMFVCGLWFVLVASLCYFTKAPVHPQPHVEVGEPYIINGAPAVGTPERAASEWDP